MPESAKVIVHYGPYKSCEIVDHREDRLTGLQTVLEKDGHTVEFKQIKDWHVVELWVNGQLIFTCDIRDLDYGGDGDLDLLCHKALTSVRTAF